MPSFLCRSIYARLSVADLDPTTVGNPITMLGPQLTAQLDHLSKQFAQRLQDGCLPETPILSTDDIPTQLQYVGKYKDSPIIMVIVGKDIFMTAPANLATQLALKLAAVRKQTHMDDKSISAQVSPNINEAMGIKDTINIHLPPTPRMTKSISKSVCPNHIRDTPLANPTKPQALCLTVQLSPECFFPIPDQSANPSRPRFFEVKIDVYLNGELCSSSLVPERGSKTVYTHRFTGRRIERLLERPWILRPARQASDGALQDDERRKSDEIEQRWKSLGNLFQEEADKRERDERGNHKALGDYLEALAKLEIPQQLYDLKKHGGLNFGVIDVVLTSGIGQKDGPQERYILRPTAIRANTMAPIRNSRKILRLMKPKGSHGGRANAVTRVKSSSIANEKMTSGRRLTPKITSGPQVPKSLAKKRYQGTGDHVADEAKNTEKKRTGRFKPGFDFGIPRPTLSQKIEQIETNSQFLVNEENSVAGRTRRSLPMVTVLASAKKRKIVVLKSMAPAFLDLLKQAKSDLAVKVKSKPKNTPKIANQLVDAKSPSSSRDARLAQQASIAEWQPPPLSEDCIIGYPSHAVRPVNTERGGWFEENSVICGFRFLIT